VSAETSVKSAQLTVENARKTLADTKLYAPTDGVVASIKNTVGEAVIGTGTGSSSSETSTGVSSTGSGTSGAKSTTGASGSGTSSGGSSSTTGGGTGAASSGTHGGNTSASGGGTSGTGNGTSASPTSGGIGSSGISGLSGGNGGTTTSNSGGGTFHDIANTSSSGGTGASGAGSASASTSSESSSSSSSFIELTDLRGYQLVVPLSESEIVRVHVGALATVTVEALEGRKFAAEVVSLPVLSTTSSGVVSYDVTFQLNQVEAALKPGMSATAEVVVKQAEGVNVPTSAISADSVTVERGGKQVRQRVVTGLAGNTSTIVLSGLKAGETIVLPAASTTNSSASLTSKLAGRAGAGGLGGGGAGGGFAGGGGAFFRGGG
jgi:hypothetical protein